MTMTRTAVRKITISLPEYLVEFADQRAARSSTSRSQVISQALTIIKALEEEKLAAEGYQFYAGEAVEFAAATAQAATEAWNIMEENWDADQEG
jgi:metal-responsive CopG/Arc/MetJ family transcriptional regulator